MSVLEIKNLHATVEDNEILKGVNLTLRSGEIHAMMGPNGSGKSTLAYVIAGHPHYEITEGDIILDGESPTSYGRQSPMYEAILSRKMAMDAAALSGATLCPCVSFAVS